MKKEKLESFYQPTSLRPAPTPKPKRRERVEYVVAVLRSKDNYGVYGGPYAKLVNALEVNPNDELDVENDGGYWVIDSGAVSTSVIVRFNKDGTDEVVYKWSSKRSGWVKVKGVK